MMDLLLPRGGQGGLNALGGKGEGEGRTAQRTTICKHVSCDNALRILPRGSNVVPFWAVYYNS